MWMGVAAQLVLAGALWLIGRWGRGNAEALAGTDAEREHRVAALRRGGLACYAAAAFFAVMTVPAML